MTNRELFLYNTASRSKEKFTGRDGAVGIYCCGPTVYDYAHVGNLRTYIWEDVLVKTLRALSYEVTHVMNITDVGHLTDDADSGEDKMEKGAKREGKTAWDIAEYYRKVFFEDLKILNCQFPDVSCRATDHIPEMISLVTTLEAKGFTYKTTDGIYFDTARFPSYCDFARLDPDTMRAGARVDMGDKRNLTDFALWKFSAEGTKRQMEWESPWGKGFPGWAIECSAMSLKYLPQPIDIHCGGQEHVRVHHTNEIAQSEAATGKQFVRYWIHGEWLMFGNDKMSKSTGAFARVADLITEGIDPLAYRLFVFSAHHRSPLSFNWDGLRGAATALKNLRKQVADLKTRAHDGISISQHRIDEILNPFWGAMCDDLNLPQAMAAIWEILRDANITDGERLAVIAVADGVLGLDLLSVQVEEDSILLIEESGVKVKIISRKPIDPELARGLAVMIVERKNARKARDYARADQLRKELSERSVTVNDLPDGSTECVLSS